MGRLANALGVELIAAEAARPTEHPDALDYMAPSRDRIRLSPAVSKEMIVSVRIAAVAPTAGVIGRPTCLNGGAP
jgi:hypothetical protein